MADFNDNSALYNSALPLSVEVGMNLNGKPTGRSGEIIFLAFPTYLSSSFSPCSITGLDGEDLVEEDRLSRRMINVIYDKSKKLEEWRKPVFGCSDYIREIIPFTKASVDFLVENGFRKVDCCFPFLRPYPAYSFLEKA